MIRDGNISPNACRITSALVASVVTIHSFSLYFEKLISHFNFGIGVGNFIFYFL